MQQALDKFAEYEWYDNHKTEVIQSCHRKGYHHLIGPFGTPLAMRVGDAAKFGSCWHAGLAGYYERHNAQLVYEKRLVRSALRYNQEWQKQFAIANAQLQNRYKIARGMQQLLLYFDHFRNEDEFFEVIDSEVGFIYLVRPRPAELLFKPFIYVGTLDRVLRRQTMRDVVVGETKTCSGDPAMRLKEMRLDRQTQGYFKMLQSMDIDRVGGVVLDAAQITATKITNDVFCRDFVQLKDLDGEQWRLETIEIVEQWRHLRERARLFTGDNQRVLAVFDKRTKECTHYGLCPFYDMCLYGVTADTLAGHSPNLWHPLKENAEVITDAS